MRNAKISCQIWLLLLAIACTFRPAYAQVKYARYDATQNQTVSLVSLLGEMERAAGVRFNYNSQLLSGRHVPAMDIRFIRAGQIEKKLNEFLSSIGLVCRRIGEKDFVIRQEDKKRTADFGNQITTEFLVFEDDQSVSGRVVDSAGSPLSGVTVQLKNSTIATVTDASGRYKLENVPDDAVLVFTLVGFNDAEVRVNGRETVDIAMVILPSELEQVVVTALGIRRSEKSLGYAVQKVSGEALQTVKGVNIATSLTGKVSGLLIKNSTEFFEAPTLELRGETPLLVIDGVPYGNMTLRDISPDDIENIDVLKGATASALYGARGGSGAVIVTTKKGALKSGLSVSLNSNTMVAAGFLALPKVQSSYSAGLGGTYDPTDYVWGEKLDIGRKAMQWNPVTKQMEEMELTSRGKDNFKNFLQTGIITNNNISVTQTGENGSLRASFSHIHETGQYPNAKLNMMNFTLGGDLKVGDKFTLESQVGYNRKTAPQIAGKGYSAQGYIYNILVWTGPEYDLSQYKDYWLIKDQKQNWHYSAWYDNPYMMAYEKLQSIEQNKMNASVSASYKLFQGAKLMLRNGFDLYSNEEVKRNPPGIYSTRGWHARGMYSADNFTGHSLNSDLLFSINRKVGDFTIDGLAGGTIYYFKDKNLFARTRNGITIPGYYSLYASVERPDVSAYMNRKQVNSLFGKASVSWKNRVFVDVTGRNDWSSTLPKATRSYFYPSVGSSVILSEFFRMPQFIDFIKLRGSWAVSKMDLGVYATNQTYSITTAAWENLNAATYPGSISTGNVKPETNRTWEIGTSAYFLKKRLRADVTYYNKYNYNIQRRASISSMSGFTSTLVNIDETYVRRGWEVSLDATVFKNAKFQWETGLNWSKSHRFYHSLDPKYSADNLWTKKGERVDVFADYFWEKDSRGNLIHREDGLPIYSDYRKLYGFRDPDWIWGWSNRVSIGNFHIGLNFDGRKGGLLFNYTNNKMWDTGSHPDSDNQWRYDEVVNGNISFVGQGVKLVSGEVEYDKYGQIVKDTRVFAPNDTKVSYESYAREYRDGNEGNTDPTFFKLRELSLGYNLPGKLAGKVGAKMASVSVTGQNVFLWTKDFRFVDPDRNNDDVSSPSQRYLGLDIKLTF